jgi:hypothetical protein
MPLIKLQFEPGINREVTKYTNELGWNDCDKVRFRQGYPEKIGGWQKISDSTYLGVARSLHQWTDLDYVKYTGVGTSVKFYIESGGDYTDITPIRETASLTNPFTTNTTAGTEKVVLVADVGHGALAGDYVTFSGSGAVGGIPADNLNKEHAITTVVDVDSYKITVATSATSVATAGGSVTAKYQINTGPGQVIPTDGYSSNFFDGGGWNQGNAGSESLRTYNQANFGEDLIFGPRGGEMFYWDATNGLSTRGVPVKSVNNGAAISLASNPFTTASGSKTVTVTDATGLRAYEIGQHVTFVGILSAIGGVPAADFNDRFEILTVDSGANTYTIAVATAASGTATGGGTPVAQYELSANVPVVQDMLMVSDASRFVFCFGTNPFDVITKNPMLIRWSDQEDMFDWRPRSTNQAGDITLSQGTEIISAIQSRQEILVFTDSAVYSLQYVGAPVVWGSQLVGSNTSIASSKAVAYANGVAYWMGIGKFYKYDGNVQPLQCDVRKYIFDDLNDGQYGQVFAGTVEEFHEVWWFYCSSEQSVPDKYVVYNYLEDVWYYGTLSRSAWLDSPINNHPIAATGSNNLVEHENGVDDVEGATIEGISAFIQSGQFGIESGNSFSFVDKVIPDVSFLGTTAGSANVTFTLNASSEPGSGDNAPLSEGGNSAGTSTSQSNVDLYTDKLDIRVRGRQMSLRVANNDTTGVTWQLGTPRLNIRPDGRRGS